MELKSVVVLTLLFLSIYPVIVTSSVTGSEYLVDLGKDPSILDQLVSYGCRTLRLFNLFSIALVECPRSVPVGKLGGDSIFPNLEVSKAEIDLRIVGSLSELGNQGGEYATTWWSWAISRVGVDVVWRYFGKAGEGVVVAVLDTGIDPNHPLLAGKLVTTDPKDPTHPGGWIEFDRKGRPVCTRPRDTDGHGTWVSSIVAGGDTSTYIFGVIPSAKLMVASVLPGGYGTFAQVLAGLEWVLRPYDCYKRYVEVPRPLAVSMSLGALMNYSNVFLPAVRKLLESGIVVVAAIGNGGPHSSSNPGNIWGVIGVGAVDFDDEVTYFSSYEEVEWPSPPTEWPFKDQYPKRYSKPDLVAPGVVVPGAFPGNLLAIGSGTSAATPLVAGVAAIAASELRNRGFSGIKLVEAVYDAVTTTATPLNQPGSGYGRVRSYLTVAKAMNSWVEPVSVSALPISTKPGDKVRVTANIPAGRTIDVYISGVRVFSGPYPVAGVTFSVPSTHIGGNIVSVVSSDGRAYGETLVYANPVMSIASNMTSGGLYDLYISGIGIGSSVRVNVAGNVLLVGSSNLRGTLAAKIIAPYVSEGRLVLVTALDLSIPGVSLSATVFVAPPMVKVEVVEEPARVSVKSYYAVGEVGTIEVLLPREGFNVSLRQVYPDYPVLRVVNASIRRSLAILFVEITGYPREGVAFVEVSTCYANTCAKSIEPINIVLVDPVKSIASVVAGLQKLVGELSDSLRAVLEKNTEMSLALERLNLTVREISSNLSRVSSSLVDLGQAVTSISRRVEEAEVEISKFDASIADVRSKLAVIGEHVEELRSYYDRTSEELDKVWEDLSKLSTVVSAITLVSLLAIAAALLSLARSIRASSTRLASSG